MRALAALALAVTLYGQTPFRVPFKCAEDEVQAMGESCNAGEPCAVYLELSALEVLGPKVFVTGNLHGDTATVASILLMSDDGGRTWTEPHERIRSAVLDQIQFIDFEMGWVGGQLLLGTPKDPFLLITHDGGKSWRRQPVFEDTHPGTIEQFWFDSRNSGVLLIDRVQASETGARYELLESMTGGESWIPRETQAAPIQLNKTRPAANPDWRLRPDAGLKSYRVEHRESGKWTAVALFPVLVASCTAAEPVLAEPSQDSEKAEPEAEKKADAPAAPKRPPTLRKKPTP